VLVYWGVGSGRVVVGGWKWVVLVYWGAGSGRGVARRWKCVVLVYWGWVVAEG
jgi:hypothetical protein